MKKLQVFIALAIVTIISSCSKDDAITPANFAEIKLIDIKAKNNLMLATNILTTDGTGILWSAGTVVVFKTSTSTYGKFEVLSINPALNNALKLNVVLFNADGTIKSATNNLVIRGTYGCNLDIPAEDGVGLQSDFKWNRFGANSVNTSLDPLNGAVFLKYMEQSF